MSIACRVRVDGGRAARRLRLLALSVPSIGLLACLVCLMSGSPAWLDSPSHSANTLGRLAHPLLMTALATGALGLAWLALRGARGSPSGATLTLNANETLSLDQQSYHLHAVSRLPGLILLVLTPISEPHRKLDSSGPRPGRTRVVLLGQDAQNPDQWRRLNVWLLWVGRASDSLSV